MKCCMLALAGAGLLAAGCNQSVERVSQEFNQLPGPVQHVVRKEAPNAEVADVTRKNREGREIYQITFRDDRRYPPMEVAANGMIVKYEAGTAALGRSGVPSGVAQGSGSSGGALSALPLGVQRAIEEEAPKAQAVDIRRKEKNGQVIYEVEYAGKTPRPVLHVMADGTVLKRPGEVVRRGETTNQVDAIR